MPITVRDIREKVFSKQVRGYSEAEVDDFLDEIADQMEILIRENRDMLTQIETQAELASARPATVEIVEPAPLIVEAEQPAESMPATADVMEDTGYFKNLETTLRETLINAQRLADETVAEARKKSNQMISSAEEQANAIVATSKVEAEATQAEMDELRRAAEDYRARFLRLVKDQALVLKSDGELFE